MSAWSVYASSQPLGLRACVFYVQSRLWGDEYFAVLLPDVLVKDADPTNDLSLMIQRFNEHMPHKLWLKRCLTIWSISMVLFDVASVPNEGQSIVMQGIVEKPAVGSAPSNLSVVGR